MFLIKMSKNGKKRYPFSIVALYIVHRENDRLTALYSVNLYNIQFVECATLFINYNIF